MTTWVLCGTQEQEPLHTTERSRCRVSTQVVVGGWLMSMMQGLKEGLLHVFLLGRIVEINLCNILEITWGNTYMTFICQRQDLKWPQYQQSRQDQLHDRRSGSTTSTQHNSMRSRSTQGHTCRKQQWLASKKHQVNMCLICSTNITSHITNQWEAVVPNEYSW